jgi:hypothetical protein
VATAWNSANAGALTITTNAFFSSDVAFAGGTFTMSGTSLEFHGDSVNFSNLTSFSNSGTLSLKYAGGGTTSLTVAGRNLGSVLVDTNGGVTVVNVLDAWTAQAGQVLVQSNQVLNATADYTNTALTRVFGTFDGAAVTTFTGGLTVEASGAVNLSGATVVFGGTLTNSAGGTITFDGGAQGVTLGARDIGRFTVTGAGTKTFDALLSTAGPSSVTTNAVLAVTPGNASFGGTSVTVDGGAAITVAGTLSLTAGLLDIDSAAAAMGLTVTGATTTSAGSTLTLDAVADFNGDVTVAGALDVRRRG